MALLYFLVACFSANAVMAKQCTFGYSKIDYIDTDKFLGQWYALYEQPEMAKTYSHFKYNFQLAGAKNTADVYLKAIRNLRERSYVGKASMNDDGSFQYIGKENNFSGQYKVLDTDYDCYAIMRGCPKKGPVKVLNWVQYRSTTPTAECEKAAQDGMKAIGIDSTKFFRQTYP